MRVAGGVFNRARCCYLSPVSTAAPTLSVIIPTWNELRRIARTLERAREWADSRADVLEVLVVDDGSTDATAVVVRDFARDWRLVRCVALARHLGKGGAVRLGMLEARGDLRLMTDADLSVSLDQTDKLLAQVARGGDLIIGSRRMPDSILDPPQGPGRRVMEATFRTIRRRLLLTHIRDTQCGFKLFTRRAAEVIFSRTTVDSLAFDCEALALADLLGLSVVEVGVRWSNDADSRVRPVRDSLVMLRDVWRMRKAMRNAARRDG